MKKQKTMSQANLRKDHLIPENERHLVHCLLTKRDHQPDKKTYIDRPSIQKFTVVDFRTMQQQGNLKSFDKVVILHDPNQGGDEGVNPGPIDPLEAPGAVDSPQPEFEQGAEESFPQEAALFPDDPAELKKFRTAYKKKYQEEADPKATVADLKELLK